MYPVLRLFVGRGLAPAVFSKIPNRICLHISTAADVGKKPARLTYLGTCEPAALVYVGHLAAEIVCTDNRTVKRMSKAERRIRVY